jgi:hypothetical protein
MYLQCHIEAHSDFFLLLFGIWSRDLNAGRDDSVKIDNSSIEKVEEFK